MESTDVSDAVERTWQILADEEEWISERGAGYLRAMERGIAAG